MSSGPDSVVIKNAHIVTPVSGDGELWRMAEYTPGAMWIEAGRIRWIGEQAELPEQAAQATVVDAQNRLVTPGFVDCHTHPVFGRHRAHEFELRIKGATYVEISRAGGGIRFSVRDLRRTSKEELVQKLLPRLDSFIAHGTTTIEAKSGYGLSVEDELKSLEVLQTLSQQHPIEIVPTFLGAHEIPDEYRDRREQYIELIINEMLPRVAEERFAQFIDIFCEDHVFTAAEARRILLAGKDYGLRPKIHADQLTDNGGAEVAVEVQAVSADHLEHTPPEMDERLLEAGVVPVMLPGADFFLSSSLYGPARRMISAGLPVALATDFNPGTCMCENMQLMLTLAALQLKMTPAEALTAATLHAAMAIDRQHDIGSLEPGKQADFVLWHVTSLSELPYHFGINHVWQVYKKGERLYETEIHPLSDVENND